MPPVVNPNLTRASRSAAFPEAEQLPRTTATATPIVPVGTAVAVAADAAPAAAPAAAATPAATGVFKMMPVRETGLIVFNIHILVNF